MRIRSQIATRIILVGFVALFVIFFSRPHGVSHAPSLGEQVPGFNLKKDTGEPVTISDFRGKILVLNFWASWCAPCLDELPSLNRLSERYADKGVQVVGISVDEDPDAYRNFLTKNRISFLTLRNHTRSVSEQYGTYKLPETYIISRDGRLLNKIIGGTDWTDREMLTYFDGLVGGS
jgi:cytochrome c biogenesis protein CcmG/thiol:disulfide interchange protein DsbE